MSLIDWIRTNGEWAAIIIVAGMLLVLGIVLKVLTQ